MTNHQKVAFLKIIFCVTIVIKKYGITRSSAKLMPVALAMWAAIRDPIWLSLSAITNIKSLPSFSFNKIKNNQSHDLL